MFLKRLWTINNEYNFRINLSGQGARKYKCDTKIRLSYESIEAKKIIKIIQEKLISWKIEFSMLKFFLKYL